MKLMQCKRCGGELKKQDGEYYCEYCHATYEDDALERAYAELKNSIENLVGGQVEETFLRERERALANLRRQLWDKTREKYVNSKAIVKLCREIKKIDSEDFSANFYEVMNDESEDSTRVTAFLDEIDVEERRDYIDDVVEFVVKSLKIEYLTSLNLLVERAYKSDKVKYGEMMTKIEDEAEKVEEGTYDLERPRDVFVAYSSKDVKRVNELVRYLEGQGIECFVAMRNLQQGRKSVENYQRALETAMDNCKIFLFVSSKNSRALSCDAIKRELPYVKRRDLEFKPEYRNNYEKMPEKYRKPRIQYRVDDERTPATDRQIGEFFGSLQWRYDLDSVSEQIGLYLSEDIYEETEEKPVAPKPAVNEEALYEDFKKRMREEEERKAEELRKAEEARKSEEARKVEEARRAEEQRKAEEVRKAEEIRKAEEQRKAEEENLRLAQRRINLSVFQMGLDEGTLTGYKGKEEDVEIPYGVTNIGKDAFAFSKNVKTITMAKSVKNIDKGAFSSCKNLTSVKLGKGVTTIGTDAFRWCKNLESIDFSKAPVETIEKDAFTDCVKLKEVILPQGLKRIGKNAFYSCKALEKVVIPKSVEIIEEGAFMSSPNLAIYAETKGKPIGWIQAGVWKNWNYDNRPVVWGYNYTEQPTEKAEELSKFADSTDFEIKNGVLKAYNGKGETIYVPNGVTSIARYALSNTKSVKTVFLPDSVERIQAFAFFGNKNLTSVKLGKGVKTIENGAFMNCKALESVEMENSSVETIDKDAFSGCSNLKEIKLPNGLKRIGAQAFYGCKGVTENIFIPKSVEVIEDSAFMNCTGAIYAEVMEKPDGWVSGVWKNWLGTGNRPVKWGAVKTDNGMYHRKLK